MGDIVTIDDFDNLGKSSRNSPKTALKVLISTQPVKDILKHYIANGDVTGHKLSDWLEATREIIIYDKADSHLLAPFAEVKLYQMQQHLRAVIQSRLEVDRSTGKLTGQISPRLLIANSKKQQPKQ